MQSKAVHFGLLFSFLSIGALAVVLQTILLREFLVVLSGNELGLSLVFAGWLFGVTSGAFLGSILSKFLKSGIFSYLLVLLILLCCSPGFLYFVRILRHIIEIPVGQVPPFIDLAIASFAVATPAAFPIGLIFPFAGMFANHIGFADKSIGALYTFEAIGATLGGLIYTFILAGNVDSFNSLWPFLIASILSAAFLFYYLKKHVIAIPLLFISVLIVSLAIFGFFSSLNQKSILKRWTSIAPGLSFLESVDSRYQNLEAGRLSEQISIYGNGEVFTSFPDSRNFQIEANLIACQHPAPHSALIIGAGAEGLVPFLLQHRLSYLDYVETDAKAISLIGRYLSKATKDALTDPRVNIIATDGRHYVQNTNKKYDLVILNLPDPSTAMINRFFTLEFFKEIKNILGPQGVFTFSLTSAVNYIGEEVGLYIGSIYNTAKNVFPEIVILPGDTAWFFLSKEKNSCSDDWTLLQKRYRDRGLPEDQFSTVMFKILMPVERIESFKKNLENFRYVRINRDTRPVTYFYNLLLWDQFSKGNLKPYLDFISNLGISPILLILVIGGVILLILISILKKGRLKLSRQICSTTVIFSTGFAGMGLEIVLLLAFQSAQGALYERIGLFVAFYMLGLAGGGWVTTNQLVDRTRTILRYIYATELLLLILSLSMVFLISIILPSPVYYLLALIIGFGAGMQFPLAGAFAKTVDDKVGPVAGLIDWADHLGAFLGAVITGILFIPLFGLPITCMAFAVLKGASLVASLGLLGLDKKNT